MKKLDQALAFLAYSKRVSKQLLDLKNLRHFHLIFRGFTPNKGKFYDFRKYGYNAYVTDYSRYNKTTFINYNFRDLLKDKYISWLFLKQYTNRVVPVYGLIDNGICFLLDSNNNLERLFHVEKKYVIKPRSGRGGEGVHVLEVIDDKYYLNDRLIPDMEGIFKDFNNHILVPYVIQHEYSKRIYSKTLNTIRLLSCVLNNEVRIIRAGHRFGGVNTGVVDNFAQGGISANIDVSTGILDDPTTIKQETSNVIKVLVHPYTGEKILGVKVPYWDLLTKEMTLLHNSIKFIKYIGWDVAITPNGYAIIEANYVSDLDGLQMHAPLLTDDFNRKFYSQHT